MSTVNSDSELSSATAGRMTDEGSRYDSDDSQPQQAPQSFCGRSDSFYTADPFAFDDVVREVVKEDRPYTGVFEGPEKTLEVCFRRAGADGANGTQVNGDSLEGLRRLTRFDLDAICRRARCTILSQVSNRYLDAYVLSESSLFVYPYMVVIKTCGTTTLLRCIATLIELGKKLGLEIDWVGYSRKNFTFPGDQAFPHESFHQELQYLSKHRRLCERLQGNGYTLGPVTSDHWFVFVADQTVRAKSLETDTDRVINIMMFDIDENVSKLFYYDKYSDSTVEGESPEERDKRVSMMMTRAAGIDSLCPGAILDPRAFGPCGYSMNAILFRSYSTMHVTPEKGSSYASFETNQKVTSYTSLINNVVRTFKPRRFVMTLMADEGGLRELDENPLTADKSAVVVPSGLKNHKVRYKRHTMASIKVEEDTCCMMGNWVADSEDYLKMVKGNGLQ